ncbi:ABC-type polysaccharide/polyol phosphate transport system ATPase subunit [Paenibacillus forsythiae]|uniref:ABC-type polysaccharide/polyol phosphate transport system ATPase subunit n=1 Tax=Paenibacillus forsythiae TaxID=365616 RepID=A0ABU3HB88_9BACL|nr:ABC transporter ATP-binding protein [Paenibacillus forsythiae]MDT3428096.1 ABC-type polysaccharide/polyol phosphate transport system ATPase subunit [Paenibacillus forsythiae]
MSNIAIRVSDVSKKFKIFEDKPATLKDRILYKSKGVFQEKWVLQNISFDVSQGKMIGLIGRNGSGKSTLLKILTKILHPDTGKVEIVGRVSSLLELGAGFHMDFTGRENIYMNASIFGLSRKEIDGKIDEIIRFAELGPFIENPVRTYSSGMYMRLAFSIAVHVDPDILLIDEILAVGDNAFQKKCISRIENFKSQGKTIVFVSHDNGVMERLCDELYWIHESHLVEHGEPRKIIRNYMDFLNESEEKRLTAESESLAIPKENENVVPEDKAKSDRWGNKLVEISNVQIVDHKGIAKHYFEKGKSVTILIDYVASKAKIDKPVFGIGIFRMDGYCCYGTNTHIDNEKISLNENGVVEVSIEHLNLVAGEYYLDVACHHENGTPYDYITKALTFNVKSYEEEIGVAYLPHHWTHKGEPNQ